MIRDILEDVVEDIDNDGGVASLLIQIGAEGRLSGFQQAREVYNKLGGKHSTVTRLNELLRDSDQAFEVFKYDHRTRVQFRDGRNSTILWESPPIGANENLTDKPRFFIPDFSLPTFTDLREPDPEGLPVRYRRMTNDFYRGTRLSQVRVIPDGSHIRGRFSADSFWWKSHQGDRLDKYTIAFGSAAWDARIIRLALTDEEPEEPGGFFYVGVICKSETTKKTAYCFEFAGRMDDLDENTLRFLRNEVHANPSSDYLDRLLSNKFIEVKNGLTVNTIRGTSIVRCITRAISIDLRPYL